jgi:hypothetical protein
LPMPSPGIVTIVLPATFSSEFDTLVNYPDQLRIIA